MNDTNETKTPDRRLLIDRRQFLYTNYYPEKRYREDRRKSICREIGKDREIELKTPK